MSEREVNKEQHPQNSPRTGHEFETYSAPASTSLPLPIFRAMDSKTIVQLPEIASESSILFVPLHDPLPRSKPKRKRHEIDEDTPQIMENIAAAGEQEHSNRTSKPSVFRCEVAGCSKAYNSASHLKRHQRLHSQDKPYLCTECHKSFFLSHHLQYHQRTHSGEKPYVCAAEGCGKSYSQPGDYYRHLRKHTGETPYHCECGKSFIRGRDLENHRRKSHSPQNALGGTIIAMPDDRLPDEQHLTDDHPLADDHS